ncbi:hypothetical protein PT974_10210 [Cladobotryum mycophilum]|uniref:Uncharacterized protein n=1 Tax=Cladobotryum mycophilum TaxID=491253 RepID=A0ABR0S982_9HYPO
MDESRPYSEELHVSHRIKLRKFDPEGIQAALKEQQKAPLSDSANLDLRTVQRRERVWQNWLSFAEAPGKGPLKFWQDLRLESKEAESCCVVF